jgi:hypothetical protein
MTKHTKETKPAIKEEKIKDIKILLIHKVKSTVRYPPMVQNSPCAKLGMRDIE